MLFLLGYNLKVVIQLGEINFWWGGGERGGKYKFDGGRDFLGRGG